MILLLLIGVAYGQFDLCSPADSKLIEKPYPDFVPSSEDSLISNADDKDPIDHFVLIGNVVYKKTNLLKMIAIRKDLTNGRTVAFSNVENELTVIRQVENYPADFRVYFMNPLRNWETREQVFNLNPAQTSSCVDQLGLKGTVRAVMRSKTEIFLATTSKKKLKLIQVQLGTTKVNSYDIPITLTESSELIIVRLIKRKIVFVLSDSIYTLDLSGISAGEKKIAIDEYKEPTCGHFTLKGLFSIAKSYVEKIPTDEFSIQNAVVDNDHNGHQYVTILSNGTLHHYSSTQDGEKISGPGVSIQTGTILLGKSENSVFPYTALYKSSGEICRISWFKRSQMLCPVVQPEKLIEPHCDKRCVKCSCITRGMNFGLQCNGDENHKCTFLPSKQVQGKFGDKCGLKQPQFCLVEQRKDPVCEVQFAAGYDIDYSYNRIITLNSKDSNDILGKWNITTPPFISTEFAVPSGTKMCHSEKETLFSINIIVSNNHIQRQFSPSMQPKQYNKNALIGRWKKAEIRLICQPETPCRGVESFPGDLIFGQNMGIECPAWSQLVNDLAGDTEELQFCLRKPETNVTVCSDSVYRDRIGLPVSENDGDYQLLVQFRGEKVNVFDSETIQVRRGLSFESGSCWNSDLTLTAEGGMTLNCTGHQLPKKGREQFYKIQLEKPNRIGFKDQSGRRRWSITKNCGDLIQFSESGYFIVFKTPKLEKYEGQLIADQTTLRMKLYEYEVPVRCNDDDDPVDDLNSFYIHNPDHVSTNSPSGREGFPTQQLRNTWTSDRPPKIINGGLRSLWSNRLEIKFAISRNSGNFLLGWLDYYYVIFRNGKELSEWNLSKVEKMASKYKGLKFTVEQEKDYVYLHLLIPHRTEDSFNWNVFNISACVGEITHDTCDEHYKELYLINTTKMILFGAVGVVSVLLILLVVLLFGKWRKAEKSQRTLKRNVEMENLVQMGNVRPEERFKRFLENLEDDPRYGRYVPVLQNMYIDIEKIVPGAWSFDSLQGREIGSGAFGTAYKVEIDLGQKKTVVVKAHKGQGNSTGDDGYLDVTVFQSLFKEAGIMAQFEHEHVLKLSGITIDRHNRPGLISDFMNKGDLKHYLCDEHLLVEYKQLVRLAGFAARGMEYLSSKGVIHRDLAARNCLLEMRPNGRLNLKIADFGLSKALDNVYQAEMEYDIKPGSADKLPFKWMALESLSRRKFTDKSDVWSFGVLCWEMLTRCCIMPYGEVGGGWTGLLDHLKQGSRLKRPQDMDDQWYRVMISCWHEDATQRPDFPALVRFLAGHYKELARTNSMGKIRNRQKRLTVSNVRQVDVGEDEAGYAKTASLPNGKEITTPVPPPRHSLHSLPDITIYTESSIPTAGVTNEEYQHSNVTHDEYLAPNEDEYLVPTDQSIPEITKSKLV